MITLAGLKIKNIVFLEFNFKLIIYNSEHIIQWE